MPCHAMHPIQDLFLEGFHMHYNLICIFICTPICTKFYSCKKWVLQHGMRWHSSDSGEVIGGRGLEQDDTVGDRFGAAGRAEAHQDRAHDGVGSQMVGNASEGDGPRVTVIDAEVGEHRGAQVKPLAVSAGPDRGRRRPTPVAAHSE
jgi:hypothetical protein